MTRVLVVGSGVYIGSWLKEPIEFLERHAAMLATRPLWLFSSGPLPGSTKETEAADPLAQALGPLQGPGSGGHRRILELSERTHPRDHAVFMGAYDPKDPPRTFSERIVRLMPASRNILPTGDFRDWDNVEAWARGIAAALEPAGVRG